MYVDFANGVDSFMKAAKAYVSNNVHVDGYVYYLCVDFRN